MQTTEKQLESPPILIRRKQLRHFTGLSPTTVDRLERAGKFPRRRRIGAGVVGWIYEDVRQAIEVLAKKTEA